MKPNSFIRENGNSLIRLHQSDIIISQFKIKNIRDYRSSSVKGVYLKIWDIQTYRSGGDAMESGLS